MTTALSLVPALQTALKGEYRGVPPAYVDDDIYYYGRMKEVADGYPLISNPYFIEYRDSRPGLFFVADWLAAIPLLLGVPFSLAVVFNLVAWSSLFVFLAYLVARATDMPPPHSAMVAFIAYLEIYWLLFRPVAMQQVFPFFLLFLLALSGWLHDPLRRRSIWLLIITGAASFYIYSFLWQITITTMGVVFLHMVVQKKWPEIRALLSISVGTIFFSLPAITYILYQIHAAFYWETVSRINYVASHLPSMDAYNYGRWAALLTILYLCTRKWLKEYLKDGDVVMRLTIYSGLALCITSVSNIITGQDLSIGQHIGRFITLWVAVFFPVLMWRLYVCRVQVRKLHWLKLTILVMLSLACAGFLGVNLKRSLPFVKISKTDAVAIQEYAVPLAWLEHQENRAVVIWADEEISRYIPVLTKHYVLWANPGPLHLLPNTDAEDRFFASQFRALTKDEILTTFRVFEGLGPYARYADSFYKNRLRCMFSVDCSPDQSFDDWVGTQKLDALFNRQKELRKDFGAIIKKYHISYLVLDKTRGEDTYFKSLSSATKAWSNDRFVIYQWKQ